MNRPVYVCLFHCRAPQQLPAPSWGIFPLVRACQWGRSLLASFRYNTHTPRATHHPTTILPNLIKHFKNLMCLQCELVGNTVQHLCENRAKSTGAMRHQFPHKMEGGKTRLHSRSFLLSIRRTLPLVHRFAVIISQSQTPASETRINSLHRYSSALPSQSSNLTAFSVTLRGIGDSLKPLKK